MVSHANELSSFSPEEVEMSYDVVNVLENNEQSQALLDKISQTQSLSQLVGLIFQLSLLFGKLFLERLLEQRTKEKTEWPNCPQCGKRLHSKGLSPRQIQTILGVIFSMGENNSWHSFCPCK